MLQDIREVEAAARILRSAAFDPAGALKFTGFGQVARTWPGLVAHEYQRFLDELELGNCVGALWQLCDCSELLCKFSALVMILDLRAHAPNVAEAFLDRLFDNRPLSLGGWVSLTIDVSKTVVTIAARVALFAPEVGAFFAKAARSEGGKATQTELGKWLSKLVAFRNQTRGHGAYGTELAADAEVLIATASALETLLRDGALVWPAAVELRIDSLNSRESLMGADPIRKRREEYDSETHSQETVSLALVRAERTLSLSPLIALRRCRQCEKQDVFCFDSVDRTSPRPRFFLLDYLAGHRLTLPHFADPSLQILAERPPKQLAEAAEAQLSDDFSETQLKSLLLATDIENRRISPSYLLDLSTTFLSAHERGILLIEGPSQIGKSVAMAALEEQLRQDPNVAVVRFAAKKELQYTATQLDLSVTAGFREQFGREEKDQRALISLTRLLDGARKPERAFIAYLQELNVSPLKPSAIEKLVLIIDGLDELRTPQAAVGIDALLPRPEALPDGCYLILTTRPLDSGDVPSQVRKRIEGLDLGSAHGYSERYRLYPSGQDPLAMQYRDLLRGYFQQSTRERKLRAEDAARLFEVLLEKSEGLFGYFTHLTDLVADGLLSVGQAQTLPVGAPLYDVFLDALERRVGGGASGKAWASIKRVLLVMAADERAFELESAHWNEWLPQRVYRGIPLTVLARLIDLPTVNYELVWVLYSFKHLLASWRGSDRASDLSHWRLGLRDLRTTIERRWNAELMAEHRRAACALFVAYEGQGDEIPYADAAITHQALRAVWHARANTSPLTEVSLPDSHAIPFNFVFRANLSRRDPATLVQAILAALASLRDLEGSGGFPKEDAELTRAMLSLAFAESLLVNGANSKAVQASDQAIELLEAQVAARGTKHDIWRSTLAKGYSSRGDLKRAVPGYGMSAAIEDYTRAIAAFEELSAENSDPDQQDSLAMAFMTRGNAKAALPGADMSDAIRDLDRAVVLLESLAGDNLDNASFGWNLTAAISNRAALQEQAGADPALSSEHVDQAIRSLEAMVARAGAGCSPGLLDDLALLHVNRAVGLAAQNKPFASLFPDFERAIALRNSLLASSGERCPPAWRYKLARCYLALGQTRQLFAEQEAEVILQDLEHAVAHFELALSEVDDQCPPDWRYGFALAIWQRAEAKLKSAYANAQTMADYDKAIEQFELLIASSGERSADEWRNDFGVAYLNRASLKLDSPGFGIATALRDYDLADGQFSLTLASANKVVAVKVQQNLATLRRARAWCKPLVSVPAEHAAEAIRAIRVSDRILTTSVSVRAVLDAPTLAAREELLTQALQELSGQWPELARVAPTSASLVPPTCLPQGASLICKVKDGLEWAHLLWVGHTLIPLDGTGATLYAAVKCGWIRCSSIDDAFSYVALFSGHLFFAGSTILPVYSSDQIPWTDRAPAKAKLKAKKLFIEPQARHVGDTFEVVCNVLHCRALSRLRFKIPPSLQVASVDETELMLYPPVRYVIVHEKFWRFTDREETPDPSVTWAWRIARAFRGY